MRTQTLQRNYKQCTKFCKTIDNYQLISLDKTLLEVAVARKQEILVFFSYFQCTFTSTYKYLLIFFALVSKNEMIKFSALRVIIVILITPVTHYVVIFYLTFAYLLLFRITFKLYVTYCCRYIVHTL